MLTRFSRLFALSALVVAPLAAQAATGYEIVIADRGGFAQAYDSAGNLIPSFASNFNSSYTSLGLSSSRNFWGVAVDQATSQVYVGTVDSDIIYRLQSDGTILNTIAVTNGVDSAS